MKNELPAAQSKLGYTDFRAPDRCPTDIVDRFQLDRKPDHVRRHAGAIDPLRTSPASSKRVNHQRLRIADIGEMGEELHTSMNCTPAAHPPLMPKVRMPPTPLGRYFFASSAYGLSGKPG